MVTNTIIIPLKRFTIILFVGFINACSLINTDIKTVNLQVLVDEPDRIRFSGKGAGAGMMMMSSMGPTGIAIGVAIDEGISKSIAETANTNHIDFSELIKKDFLEKLNRYNQLNTGKQAITEAKLHIKRYGFIVGGGNDEPTTSEYIISYQLGNEAKWQEFHFPKQFNTEQVLLTQPLDKVKKDKLAIQLLIENGLTHFSL